MGLMYAIFLCQDFLRSVASPYCDDIGLRQFPVPMVKPVVVAALDCRIPVVVRDGSKPQVRWPDANRVVASVHHDHSVRYRPNQFLVNVTMGLGSASCFTSASGDDSVSERVSISCPEPAFAHSLDASFERDGREDVLVLIKTIFAPLLHIAKLAKVSAESWRRTKQALFLTLFHGDPLNSGEAMTLP